MIGKMRTGYGIYKKHGRETFLEAARIYVPELHSHSMDAVISDLESKWYNEDMQMTLGDKMVWDYNHGYGPLHEHMDQTDEKSADRKMEMEL